MTPSEKYLTPHAIFGDKSFDEYCSKIPSFYFKKEVPEDVIQNFEVVERLLAHSYYEYKFIDEALAKALHSFEMAMGIRYKELGRGSKKLTFNDLITQLSKDNLFETNIETLKHVKYLRNHFSHPERHSFGGIVYWNHIEYISRLINEMYEDVPLRLERKELTKKFLTFQKNAKLDRGVIIDIQNKPTLLYSLSLLFVNNKQDSVAYIFACTPIFDLETIDGSIEVPFVFKSKLINPIFSSNSMSGISYTAKQHIEFIPIEHREDFIPIFNNWHSLYQQLTNKSQFESAIQYRFPEIIIPELQDFQRM